MFPLSLKVSYGLGLNMRMRGKIEKGELGKMIENIIEDNLIQWNKM